jgi:hypothetical protein
MRPGMTLLIAALAILGAAACLLVMASHDPDAE